MARIPDPDGVGEQASCDFWSDQLFNLRVLLNDTQKAIQALTTGGHASYEIDTGQSRQRVTRIDVEQLRANVKDYMDQIATLELKLGVGCGSGTKVVTPLW